MQKNIDGLVQVYGQTFDSKKLNQGDQEIAQRAYAALFGALKEHLTDPQKQDLKPGFIDNQATIIRASARRSLTAISLSVIR